jgi:hypothetical protein
MAQLNEQFLRMQKLAGVITESQYNKKMQMLNEEITVGETYTASMPTSSDGKERMDVKVKVLGVDRNDANKFIVTPLEDKDYTNPASKQLNSFEKGKQYGVEAEFIKESLNEAIGDFNPTGFMAAIKETLKKMGYEVKDMQGSSIDPAKGQLEKDANEGKKSAVVGTLKWEDGEEVVAAVSLSQNDDTATQLKTLKDLEDKIYDVYAKDFAARLNKTNNGRVVTIGIKNKA